MKGSAALICTAAIISGTITSAYAKITSTVQESTAAETVDLSRAYPWIE